MEDMNLIFVQIVACFFLLIVWKRLYDPQEQRWKAEAQKMEKLF